MLAPGVLAQQITSAPVAGTGSVAVPVDSPWLLAATIVVLALGALAALRRGQRARRVLPLLALGLCTGLLWQSPDLRAQLLGTFTDPAGSTLPIPVTQIASGADIQGFEVADFSNAAGSALRVSAIELPDYDQCFPGGPGGALLPASTAPTPAPQACATGLALNDGDSCRVDVDTVCRGLYADRFKPVVTAVNPASGSASGALGVTITGSNFTGATAVSFDGVAATSVNVVNSTTITAVTPAHATGAVDVGVTSPAGAGALAGGFTYVATAVGQPAGGGVVAALNGGLNNLIAAAADNSAAIQWGSTGVVTGASSTSDGATNTVQITSTLGSNGGTPYAAQLCADYEIDSQGNTPCQAGNACYNDWFLPAQAQLATLYAQRIAVGGFAAGFYWSSTEFSANPGSSAVATDMAGGTTSGVGKNLVQKARCVRAFTP